MAGTTPTPRRFTPAEMTQEADAADLRSREALDELNNARMDTRLSSDEGVAYWGPELSARRRVAAMLRQGAQDASTIERLRQAEVDARASASRRLEDLQASVARLEQAAGVKRSGASDVPEAM